jgi:hypothetical protein
MASVALRTHIKLLLFYIKGVSQGANVDYKIGKISRKLKKDDKGGIRDSKRR